MCDEVLQPWPSDRLEKLDICPVCGSQNNKVLESGLVDLMSKPVTGPWVMQSCADCGIAYLSPRPDRDSISDAYRHYYTHTSDKDNLLHSSLRSIKNYLSGKYYAVASNSGGFLDHIVYLFIKAIFPLSLYFDAKSSHIFNTKRQPGRLLDVGCGNGEFLRFADRYGWHVVGVDFDESAVSEAKSSGIDVRLGDIHVIDSDERFDFISLSHVIEHVYDPVDLLHSCFDMLNEGGVLWLETPNIESLGYALYNSNWRGLEAPRHIMLFNQATLRQMLLQSGFKLIEQKNHGLSGLYMGMSSEKLLNESDPCGSSLRCASRKILKFFRVLFLEVMQLSCKRRREFLTLSAIR